MVLLKQLQLSWPPGRPLGEVRKAEIGKHPLDGPCGDAHLVNALEPNLGAAGAESMLNACLANAVAPLPNRPAMQTEVSCGRLDAVLRRIRDDSEALFHAQPVADRDHDFRHNPPLRRGHYPRQKAFAATFSLQSTLSSLW